MSTDGRRAEKNERERQARSLYPKPSSVQNAPDLDAGPGRRNQFIQVHFPLH
jgi:hypothetical protein